MLVVLAIISIVTTIALLGQTGFNRSVLLTDTAYTVALSIREMQSLGLSSRKFGSTVQNAGYGAYFSAVSPNNYVLFADTARTISPLSTCLVGAAGTPEAKPGDCIYTAGSDGIVQTYSFSRGFSISKFCGYENGTYLCSNTAPPGTKLDSLSVLFLRSSTDSIMYGYRNGNWAPLTSAEIYIASADGLGERGICISRVGQISVAYGTCP